MSSFTDFVLEEWEKRKEKKEEAERAPVADSQSDGKSELKWKSNQ